MNRSRLSRQKTVVGMLRYRGCPWRGPVLSPPRRSEGEHASHVIVLAGETPDLRTELLHAALRQQEECVIPCNPGQGPRRLHRAFSGTSYGDTGGVEVFLIRGR